MNEEDHAEAEESDVDDRDDEDVENSHISDKELYDLVQKVESVKATSKLKQNTSTLALKKVSVLVIMYSM